MASKLRRIHLHGDLAEKFGKVHEYECEYPVEAVNFLTSQLPGFKAEFLKSNHMAVVKQKGQKLQTLDEHGVQMSLGNCEDVHLVPSPQGSGLETGALVATAVLGTTVAATSAAAIATTILLNLAFSFAVGAVVKMLSSSPSTSGDTGKAEDRSFLFNGVQNVNEQGFPVPLKFGKIRGGSVVASAGIKNYDLPMPDPVETPAPPKPDYWYPTTGDGE